MNLEFVKEICLCFGASGRENEIVKTLKNKLSPLCESCETDDFGNLFCKRTDNKNLLNVALDAHTDTVGLVVKEVCDNGFLKFSPLGGIDPRVLPGAEVVVRGKKEVLGVITSKPPHLMEEADKQKAPKTEDMFIDTGFENASDVISVGDVVTYRQKIDVLGECITGTYLDDRACCAAIAEIFERLKDKNLPFNLIASFSVQEELGLLGAKAQKINPDVVIALDVTHGQTPDEKSDLAFKCGQGTAIGFGPSLDKKLYELIEDAAKSKNLPYQTEVIEASSGTNAWAYQISEKPAVCGVLSLPLKFMHTPVETAFISDYDNLVEITCHFLEKLTAEKLDDLVKDQILR